MGSSNYLRILWQHLLQLLADRLGVIFFARQSEIFGYPEYIGVNRHDRFIENRKQNDRGCFSSNTRE